MQVQKLENNNINFNAKFQLEGYTKDISKRVQNKWLAKAKSIGTETDTITLKFGRPEIEEDSWDEISKPKTVLIKSRRVRLISKINNKSDEKMFSYYTSENCDIHSRMLERISDYLNKLSVK